MRLNADAGQAFPILEACPCDQGVATIVRYGEPVLCFPSHMIETVPIAPLLWQLGN